MSIQRNTSTPREDLEGALEEIERYKAEMTAAKDYLWSEYSIEEQDIQRVDWD